MRIALQRGVDVRLLIGGSRSNVQIAEATIMANWRARQIGIPTRLISFKPKLSSHVKIVISDALTLAGSHNWSGGAFSGMQVQDSLLIDSADAAGFFASRFDRQWKAAKRQGDYV
jgi:phosphatidylserine/phosphatidylglycerophosphate/cardiolipin synthase-like enzyme